MVCYMLEQPYHEGFYTVLGLFLGSLWFLVSKVCKCNHKIFFWLFAFPFTLALLAIGGYFWKKVFNNHTLNHKYIVVCLEKLYLIWPRSLESIFEINNIKFILDQGPWSQIQKLSKYIFQHYVYCYKCYFDLLNKLRRRTVWNDF